MCQALFGVGGGGGGGMLSECGEKRGRLKFEVTPDCILVSRMTQKCLRGTFKTR